ncbi:MAG: hypothetical protein VB064_01925 [Oscillospiraceae bacterium]|nr:hypothetical protein [Oscillospiraceae bacterium]
MMKQIILPLLLIALLPLILKLLIKLRCGFAIVYIVLANTVLRDWASSNTRLSDGILLAIIVLTLISWGVTIYKKLAEHYGFSRAAKQRKKLLAAQLKAAQSAGVPTGKVKIHFYDGLPLVRY